MARRLQWRTRENTSVMGSRIVWREWRRIWVAHRVYLVLVEVKIILGEGGEEEHDLGLDNGMYIRVGRIVVVHCTARSSCPSAGRLRATRSHACTGSRFRDNFVGVGWKRVGWKAPFVGRESLDDPLHKTCPRFRRGAKYSHRQPRQSPARDPAPRGIFQSEIQFLWRRSIVISSTKA